VIPESGIIYPDEDNYRGLLLSFSGIDSILIDIASEPRNEVFTPNQAGR